VNPICGQRYYFHERVIKRPARLGETKEANLSTRGDRAAVITETFRFLAASKNSPDSLACSLDASAIEVRNVFTAAVLAVGVRLMSKYADIPMDFPDATLVWIAEVSGTEKVLTLDRRGFSSFRFGKNRRFKLVLDL
jgi:uncharacterized protein